MSVHSRWNHQRPGSTSERGQSFERREAPNARHVQVGERATPRGGRLTHGHRFVERPLRDRRPRDALLVDEPGCGDRPVGVRLARGQHDPGPGATEHHPEQPPFVLQAGAVALGLRDGMLERRQVEHRLRAGQAGEVPFDGSRDDHGVELGTDRAVRGQHADGVERRGIARPIARTVLTGVERSHERFGRRVGRVAGFGDDVGEPDDDVDLSPGAGRALGVGHQTRRVRQVLPEDPERFEHRPVGHGRRVLEHLAHDIDLGGLGLREAFRVIERRADRSLHRLGRAHHPARQRPATAAPGRT